MTPENTYKRIIQAHLDKNHWQYSRLSCRLGSKVVVVYGWPSMQGQGAIAAGYVAERWAKLEKLARDNGFTVKKSYE
jgi:hypothetical protein